MSRISLRIAYSIIVAGLFIIAAVMAIDYQNLNFDHYMVFCLLVIFIFLFGFAIGQRLAKPLQQLLKKANELKAGDLKTRLDLKTRDELGELATTFNKVAETFDQRNDRNESVKKSADIKSKTRILLLEEIVSSLERKVKNRTLEFQRMNAVVERLEGELAAKDQELMTLKNKTGKKRISKKNLA